MDDGGDGGKNTSVFTDVILVTFGTNMFGNNVDGLLIKLYNRCEHISAADSCIKQETFW